MEIELRSVNVDLVAHSGAAAQRVLQDVSLSVQRGECVVIMGASGAGKSTLASVLAGLVAPSSGTVAGAALGRVRMVLQRPEATFLTDTVLDEVSLAATWNGAAVPAAQHAARQTLAQLGLPDGIDSVDPLELSGGEQRRVAIAAVVASNPRVLVLDEPSAGLDSIARTELHTSIRALHAAGQSIVLITHDPSEAAALGTRLLVLDGGRVAYDGPIDAVLGDPAQAATLGLTASADIRVAHAAAAARGIELGAISTDPSGVRDLLIELVRRDQHGPVVGHHSAATAARLADVSRAIPPLPPAIDARARLGATAFVVAAALVAQSLLVVAVITAAALLVLACARVERARLRTGLRPVVALGVALVLLQAIIGNSVTVELWPGREIESGMLAALLRILQVLAIVASTLALTARTSIVDLSAALARVLAPLRLLHVPVDEMALVTATGLGFVPVLSDELDRLRRAQAARGIGARRRGPLARARVESMLLVPLFVLSFRRAQLMAEALAVRGYAPHLPRTTWRARSTPGRDVALLLSGMLLLAGAIVL